MRTFSGKGKDRERHEREARSQTLGSNLPEMVPLRSTACNEASMPTIYPCLGAKQPCVCPQWSMNNGDCNNTAASVEKRKSLGQAVGLAVQMPCFVAPVPSRG